MSDITPDPTELERRRQWFERYTDILEHHSVIQPMAPGVVYRCPCCLYKTLDERGAFDICPVCFWEDDGQDDADADVVRGGPNGALSLTQARQHYRTYGACDRSLLKHVRKPGPHER